MDKNKPANGLIRVGGSIIERQACAQQRSKSGDARFTTGAFDGVGGLTNSIAELGP